jgi:hypothetical protein
MGEGYARNELYNLFRGRRHWIIKIIWILKKKYNVILGKKKLWFTRVNLFNLKSKLY